MESFILLVHLDILIISFRNSGRRWNFLFCILDNNTNYKYKRAYFIIKIERNLLFLVPLFIYPSVNLLFSGSYLMTGMFWFVLVFVLIYKPQQY